MQEALDAYYTGGIVNGLPAIENLRKQLVAIKQDCGGISFDARNFTDDQLKLKVSSLHTQYPSGFKKVASNSFSSVVSMCFLFVNLVCPDPALTGSESVPEIDRPSISHAKPSGQALLK